MQYQEKTIPIVFCDVGLLITHYNRTRSLKRLLLSFEKLGCVFNEIVVSDDGSKPEHLEVLKVLSHRFNFKLILAERNTGLGNNINKGQDAILSKYTLYVQEDFKPTDIFPNSLKDSLSMIDVDEDLDIIKFYAYFSYPYLKQFKYGFSEMYLPFLGLNYTKIYQYTDHPHLRRSTFLTKFGRYQEGISGDKTEYNMCLSFIRNKGKGLFYNNFDKLFVQENSEFEPSTMKRKQWRKSNNFFISILRHVYRQIKNNYQIHIVKMHK
jgi:glycosyltransferase involved in cell wall biosynthesis